jgi:hypothetical protein
MKPKITPFEGDQLLLLDLPGALPQSRPKPTGRIIVKRPMKVKHTGIN